MNTFLVGVEPGPQSHQRKTLMFHEDVLQVGMKVERRGMDEGAIRIVGVDRSKNLVALRHEGYTSYTGRASGSLYSQAVMSLYRYELRHDYQSEGASSELVCVYLVKRVAEVPIVR